MRPTSDHASTAGADPALASFLEAIRAGVAGAGVFGAPRIEGGRLICPAPAAAAPAEYRVELDAGRVWVSLVTPDRWLSHSIEADLLHTGDKIEDLIDEELVEQGYTAGGGGPLPCEHFRDRDRLFTFRSPLPFGPDDLGDPAAAEQARRALLAYEACFRRLGDMEADGE
jgi:hypothetical protein